MSSKKETSKPKGSSNSGAGAKPKPNAWSLPLKTRTPPGLVVPSKTKSVKEQILRERFLHLALTMVGQKVTLTQTNGTVLDGIFHTFTPFDSQPLEKRNKYVLKAVQVITPGTGFTAIETGSTVIVPTDKVAFIHVKSMRLESSNGNKEGFRTDTEISLQQNNKGKELVSAGNAWTSATAVSGNSRAEALVGGLDGGNRKQGGTAPLRGTIGEWDQFRANEELFDVHASFDENMYTTELHKSAIDRSKVKEAERLAREIESTVSSNIHVAEERNQVIGGDYDEEDRYSGVLVGENLETRNKKPLSYAHVAAKAEPKKPTPPVLIKEKEEEEKKDPKEAPKSSKAPDSSPVTSVEDEIEKVPEQVIEVTTPKEEAPEIEVEAVIDEEAKDSDDKKPRKLSLNPDAKSFNPGATPFIPFSNAPAPMPSHDMPIIDPITGMAIMHPHSHPQWHYRAHHMVQPGMMPMVNAQFGAMRYPGPYPGMEQHMGHVLPHHQPQHQLMPTHMPSYVSTMQDGSAAAPPVGDEQNPPTDGHPPLQQPPSQLQYPPNPYFGGGMPMHPGQPRVLPMGGYHPQMVGGPPQIQGGPGRNPYQPMYGMPQPPPQMRGPNGAPYYPAPPQLYPNYLMDDEYRGGRGGRGRGISGRRKPNGRGGRGGRAFQNTYTNNGRHTPQNGPQNADGSTPGAPSQDGEMSEPNQETTIE